MSAPGLPLHPTLSLDGAGCPRATHLPVEALGGAVVNQADPVVWEEKEIPRMGIRIEEAIHEQLCAGDTWGKRREVRGLASHTRGKDVARQPSEGGSGIRQARKGVERGRRDGDLQD